MEKTRTPVEKKSCGCEGCYYDLGKDVINFIDGIEGCGLHDCSGNKNKDIETLKDYIFYLKKENLKLREHIIMLNFLKQENIDLNNKISELNFKLKEKICFEGHSQFEELKKNSVSKDRIRKKLIEIKNRKCSDEFEFGCKVKAMLYLNELLEEENES